MLSDTAPLSPTRSGDLSSRILRSRHRKEAMHHRGGTQFLMQDFAGTKCLCTNAAFSSLPQDRRVKHRSMAAESHNYLGPLVRLCRFESWADAGVIGLISISGRQAVVEALGPSNICGACHFWSEIHRQQFSSTTPPPKRFQSVNRLRPTFLSLRISGCRASAGSRDYVRPDPWQAPTIYWRFRPG
jgi:hypothetical protein